MSFMLFNVSICYRVSAVLLPIVVQLCFRIIDDGTYFLVVYKFSPFSYLFSVYVSGLLVFELIQFYLYANTLNHILNVYYAFEVCDSWSMQ